MWSAQMKVVISVATGQQGPVVSIHSGSTHRQVCRHTRRVIPRKNSFFLKSENDRNRTGILHELVIQVVVMVMIEEVFRI